MHKLKRFEGRIIFYAKLLNEHVNLQLYAPGEAFLLIYSFVEILIFLHYMNFLFLLW